jgi:hypothetical protein
VIHHSGGVGHTGFVGSSVVEGRSQRACMYTFHSSGTGVSVDVARMTTQSHAARRLLRSVRSSLRGWASISSWSLASNSSFGGFWTSEPKKIDFIVIQSVRQSCETPPRFHFDMGRAAKPLGTGETGKGGRQALETFDMGL